MSKIVFDAGAHTGEDIQQWIRLGFTKIVAIEPQEHLCNKIKKAYSNVDVVQAALWRSNGKMPLFYGGYTSLATLDIARTQHSKFSGYGWDHEVFVNTITLDTLIDQFGVPDHLKMDIEGSEKEALQGLSTPIKSISFEYDTAFWIDAMFCVERISKLGDYRYIIRSGESTTIESDLTGDNAQLYIEEMSTRDTNFWGMIDAERIEND